MCQMVSNRTGTSRYVNLVNNILLENAIERQTHEESFTAGTHCIFNIDLTKRDKKALVAVLVLGMFVLVEHFGRIKVRYFPTMKGASLEFLVQAYGCIHGLCLVPIVTE